MPSVATSLATTRVLVYDASRHAQNIDCVDPTVPSDGVLGMCMVLKTAAKGISNAVFALLS